MSKAVKRIALTVHAESLHDDGSWRRTETVSRWLSKRGGRATFFVYPFRAQVDHRDIGDRVARLAALGHEIAQHTHFYAGERVDPPDKTDDLTPANIEHCIRRDHRTLVEIGWRPKGFVGGAWYVNPDVLDCLIRLDFRYDCSTRVPMPGRLTTSPLHSWRDRPFRHASSTGELLCVPTTCSIGEWFKDRRWLGSKGSADLPEIVYVHDYDLTVPRYWALLHCFLAFRRIVPTAFVPAEEISGEVARRGGLGRSEGKGRRDGK